MSSQVPPPACAETVNVHCAWFPDVSVAVQVTVVEPAGKVEPDGGTQTTLATAQLSAATGIGNVTMADPAPQNEPEDTVISAGQVMVGGWLSVTVTVCRHCAELPELSVTVQVTVVTPFGK